MAEDSQQRDEPRRGVLVGNTFPPSLIRRRAIFDPVPLNTLQAILHQARVVSFWGHASTLRAASALAGVDLTPAEARPALTLSPDGLPMFGGEVFTECWVVSPNFTPGYRPAVGEEVPPERITGWQVLRITFPSPSHE